MDETTAPAHAPGQGREALLVLVGITANRGDRQAIADYFRTHSPYDVFVPAIPQWLGLRAAGRWLVGHIRRKLGGRDYTRVNVLNYISGGRLFRAVARELNFLRLGRVVYDRGPIQELVPGCVARRFTDLGALLAGGLPLLDLAHGVFADLPYPVTGHEQGLIVETRPSARARQLDLDHDQVPPDAWRTDRLLPGASATVALPLSHDDVYRSELFLEQALHFFLTGSFRAQPAEHTPVVLMAAP